MKKEEKMMNEELDRVINESINKPKMTFEEAVRACNGIELDKFSKMWEKSINSLISE